MTGCHLLGNAELTLSVVTYSNQAAWYPTTLLWFRCANTLTSLNTYWQDKLNVTAHINVFLLDITRQAGSKKCPLFVYCTIQKHANSAEKSLTTGYVFRSRQSKLLQNKKNKIDQNLPLTSYRHDLLNPLRKTYVPSKVGWLKSSHVVEKSINKPHPLAHMVIESACLKGKSI